MSITSWELELLRGVVRVVDEHASLDLTEFDDETDKKYWAAEQKLAKQSISWVHLPWFLAKDEVTASEATQASRAWKKLEKLGYIERIEFPSSSRTAQIELLPAGRLAAATAVAETRTQPTRVQSFITDRCELIAGGEAERKVLYVAFLDWCEEKRIAPASLATFESQLLSNTAIGRINRQTGEKAFGQTIYTGLKIRPRETTAAS